MDTCLYSSQLDAYCDGELPQREAEVIGRHVAGCALCQAELEDVRRLSAMIEAAPRPRLSAAGWQRLYSVAPLVRQGTYVRIAEWTTALAASVLIAATVWMFNGTRSAPNTVGTEAVGWVPVAFNPPVSHDAADAPEDPKLADWVTTNASVGLNP